MQCVLIPRGSTRMYSHLASVDEEGDTQETPSGNIQVYWCENGYYWQL